jgi:hypothetical protein
MEINIADFKPSTGVGVVTPPAPMQPTIPDLFAPVAAENPPTAPIRASQAERPQYRLPTNLPAALAQLKNADLDDLLNAVIDEAARRGRMPKSLTTPPTACRPRQTAPTPDPGLTRGQVNAVRSAFKAGVKPSVIARQFGIAQSDVRKTLASDGIVLR